MQCLLGRRLWTAVGNLKQVIFLKATLLFWQLSIDSMLTLLSLSSTEKQEAQNQFALGVGVGESWQRRRLFLLVGADAHYTRDHSELCLALPPGCSFEHFWTQEKFFRSCGASGSLPRPGFGFLKCLLGSGVSGGREDWDRGVDPALQWINFVTLIK